MLHELLVQFNGVSSNPYCSWWYIQVTIWAQFTYAWLACHAVLCCAVWCCAVWCRVLCGAVQCCAMCCALCGAVQCSAVCCVWCGAVRCSVAVLCCAVLCYVVLCCVVWCCSAVLCCAMLCLCCEGGFLFRTMCRALTYQKQTITDSDNHTDRH